VYVQARPTGAGVDGGHEGGPLWVEVAGCSSVHQHGVVVVVVVVVVGRRSWVTGQVCGGVRVVVMEGSSVVQVGRVGEAGGHAHAHRSAVRAEVTRDAWQTSPFAFFFVFLLYMTEGLHVVPLPIHAHIHPHSTHRPGRSDPHVLLPVQHETAHGLAFGTVRRSLAH